jgi:hypothetical protein
LSSTTDPRSEHGQILIIFAFSLLVIFGVAALVFDGGSMLLEKRAQQNAGDAAALAGARFLPGNSTAARTAAVQVATANGFTDGVNGQTVEVHIPPISGANVGRPGFIQVVIDAEKPSFFAGIWGIISHDVGSRSVAANQSGVLGPFGMLSLHPTACPGLDVTGGGRIHTDGNIHVNSDCSSRAMRVVGTGEIVAGPNVVCNVHGGYQGGGASTVTCPIEEGVQAIPDPFLHLPAPPIPRDEVGDIIYPEPMAQEDGTTMDIPTGCPGADTHATHEEPRLCQFTASYSGTTWRLYPGYYPGGIKLLAGTFYFEPGIYHIAAGGMDATGSGISVTSVDPGGTTLGGGVLIYNSRHPAAGAGNIHLRGGSAGFNLWPLRDGRDWDGLVIFQARDVCLDVTLNGAASTMSLRGAIYVPCGTVETLGNGGNIITDQIIADKFKVTGNQGSLNILYDEDFLPTWSVAGLVE